MLNKGIRNVALLLASTLAFAGCAQGSATRSDNATSGSAGGTTVRYMNFSANGGHEEDLQAIADAFHAENPDITVQIETIPYDDYFVKLQTAVAGGTAGDAFELNYENFVTYAKNGSLAPLKGIDDSQYRKSLIDGFKVDGTQNHSATLSYSTTKTCSNKREWPCQPAAGHGPMNRQRPKP